MLGDSFISDVDRAVMTVHHQLGRKFHLRDGINRRERLAPIPPRPCAIVRSAIAARRAGVSPGAPFGHFPSRDALMMAVAEEAQRRFRVELEAALAPVPADDPLARFRAWGSAICAGRYEIRRISR